MYNNSETGDGVGARVREFFVQPGVRAALYVMIPVVALALIIAIVMAVQSGGVPKLKIDNFSEVLSGVPADTEQEIEEELYVQVATDFGKAAPTSGAVIRAGSVDGFEVGGDFFVGYFIVDVPAVEQSYVVKYFYGEIAGANEMELAGSVRLYCLTAEMEMIYNNGKCSAPGVFVKPDPLQYLLPQERDGYSLEETYSTTSESGIAIVVTLAPPESVYLSGETETYEVEKLAELAEYLVENGLDPENYEILVKYNIER